MKCDELKYERLGDAFNDYPDSTLVIRKQFVDAAIAELEESHKKEVGQLLILNREQADAANRLRDSMEQTLRRQKKKRCLAMAMWCDEAYHRECGLNPEEMTDKEFYKQQIEFWPRWSSRWLAIAEKFKPNTTRQQKD